MVAGTVSYVDHQLLHPLYRETPLLFSSSLSSYIGQEVYLKMEMMQPSGSFKNRGIGNFCFRMWQQGIKKIVLASGGNAALACAYSCRVLGMSAFVVLPQTTPCFLIERIKREGAHVTLFGKHFDDAQERAKKLAIEEEACFISPYDHPLIWEGNKTIVHELFAQGKKPKILLVVVGGGGLLTGILQGLLEVGWQDVPVMTVQMEGACAFTESLKQARMVVMQETQTVATSLVVKQPAAQALLLAKHHVIYPHIVSDKEAVGACLHFLNDEQMLLEPACSAVLAPIYKRDIFLSSFSRIAVIVSGGRAYNLELFDQHRAQFLLA